MSRFPQKLPNTAMVLAAGLGLRMRPLTLDLPKAMVEVKGRSLIDRALDRLKAAGIAKVVVNLHHKGNTLKRHLAERNDIEIAFSDETELLLETGGGVARALPLLGSGPFFVVNSDVIWLDAQGDSLHALAAAWDDAAMDALLLMHPTVMAVGYSGMGDFDMAADGRLTRREQRHVAPFLFTGIQLLHPRLFDDAPPGPFSLNRLYDKAAESGRLFGLRHQGIWMDVGTPAGLKAAEAALEDL
ncbi:nucleotidyltransferase family protein [Desertibaculum subflavum]|uniref:nucleotidyltransferase family protein n=1 Tax=Desertibaculum subflavum TaxID=2268458 RepID=UPI0034D24C7B